jgi:hypothetical protein
MGASPQCFALNKLPHQRITNMSHVYIVISQKDSESPEMAVGLYPSLEKAEKEARKIRDLTNRINCRVVALFSAPKELR